MEVGGVPLQENGQPAALGLHGLGHGGIRVAAHPRASGVQRQGFPVDTVEQQPSVGRDVGAGQGEHFLGFLHAVHLWIYQPAQGGEREAQRECEMFRPIYPARPGKTRQAGNQQTSGNEKRPCGQSLEVEGRVIIGGQQRQVVIEDDEKTASFVGKAFGQAGFRTCHVADGEEGLARATTEPFDAAVIDIMLPRLDGFAVIDGIRKGGVKFPIIVLSAKDSVESKIRGLETGADDYLAKPFSVSELVARVQAMLRRASAAAEATTLTVADITLDIASRRVHRGGVRIELQPLEFQLLEYLMRNKGRVVSRMTIMEHVWDYNFDTQTNIVESRVCRLREKIDKAFDRKLIRTVRGFGYVIE